MIFKLYRNEVRNLKIKMTTLSDILNSLESLSIKKRIIVEV
jgi:hypothetical protein